MMILIWLLIGFACYYLITNSEDAGRKNKDKKDSVEILKLRYVNGEIDQETYKRTLEVLNG